MKDTADVFVDVFFDKANNYAVKINLDTESVSNQEATSLAQRYNGDWTAQQSVQIGDRGFSLDIYSITHDRVRFADENMKLIQLGDEGAYISSRIAKEFGVGAGDTLSFSPYGGDDIYTVRIRSEERRVGKECRSRWSPYH